MTRKARAGLAAAAAAMILGSFFLLPLPRRLLFCSEIVNPYDLVGGYVVTVPGPEHQRYNDDFVGFARKWGLAAATTSYRAPDADDGSWYLYRGVTACDGVAYAWSSNVARADEFVVSFHSNRLFGSRRAEEIRNAFVAGFGKRYKIETEDDDLKRHPVRSDARTR